MKIVPISNSSNYSVKKNPNFQGVTTDYKVNLGKGDLKNNSYCHKNSSVEDIIGAYHSNYTGKAYFAEPMEHVGDAIKDKVDFVVYDNEPKYPALNDVKENYLGRLRKDFKKDFEEVREYFYRREKGGFANVEEAKAKQREAAELTGFYDRAGDARYRKETLEDEVDVLDKKIAQKEEEIKALEKEQAKKIENKKILEIKEENYVQKDAKYGELKPLAEQTIDKDKNETGFIESQLTKMKQKIAECRKAVKEHIEAIKKLSIEIADKKVEKGVLEADRNTKNLKITEIIKKELTPSFNALADFCKNHNVKIKW